MARFPSRGRWPIRVSIEYNGSSECGSFSGDGSLRRQVGDIMGGMIPISKLAATVQPSATLVAGAKARQLQAQGIQVFDFSLGEPDFPTPEHICQAALQ